MRRFEFRPPYSKENDGISWSRVAAASPDKGCVPMRSTEISASLLIHEPLFPNPLNLLTLLDLMN